MGRSVTFKGWPVPCPRCGCLRKSPKNKNSLCVDCKYVLTAEEAKAWTEQKVAA